MIFWKYYTRFWEIFLFVPIFIFWYFVNFQLDILLLFFILLMCQFFIWAFLKLFFFKERPQKMHYNWYLSKIAASAFPSLHSANTFLLFLFTLYYTNFYISFGFFIFWLSISYSRILLQKHFYIDIVNWALLASTCYFISSFFHFI